MLRLLVQKEVREYLRDRRVLVGSILLPMGLVIAISLFLAALHGFLESPGKAEIAVFGAEKGAALLRSDLAKREFTVRRVGSLQEGLHLVREREVRLLVYIPTDLTLALRDGHAAEVQIHLDKNSLPAQLALSRLQTAIQVLNTGRRELVLRQAGLADQDLEPIRIRTVATTQAEAFGGQFAPTFLPYLLVVFAFVGGMGVAADTVAGEKERGTLETLLVSPVGRVQIAIAKLLSMSCVCLASSLSALAGLLVVLFLGWGQDGSLLPTGFRLSATPLVGALLTMLPLVLMFAAILTTVSAFARNQREATTYASAISFLVLVPAIASQFIGYTDLASEPWVGLVPVLNSAMVIQQLLQGEVDWTLFGLTLATSCTLAAIALAIQVGLFRREEVLFRV